ncbi:unnamed protein product [Effrenium voratum]|nr:unnamed protein product [Effrenium voratum]
MVCPWLIWRWSCWARCPAFGRSEVPWAWAQCGTPGWWMPQMRTAKGMGSCSFPTRTTSHRPTCWRGSPTRRSGRCTTTRDRQARHQQVHLCGDCHIPARLLCRWRAAHASPAEHGRPQALRAPRDLLSATMPSIAQSPDHVPGFQAPPGVSAQDLVRDISLHLWLPLKMVTNLVQDVFAFNFFRHAFEVDLSHEELQMLKEWLSVHSRIIVGLSSISGGKRCAELAKVLEDKVAAGAFGQRLMKEAERRGMVGADRLRKVIFEFSFAGFGGDGPGGGLATMKLLRLLQSKPEYVPMFKKDPEAFILEVIRTRGGGGAGMNPWIVESTQTHTLSTGRVVTETAGSHGATIALHANHDPAVFGGPKRDLDYEALAFMPGRENADRFLSFVAEYGEIKKCNAS